MSGSAGAMQDKNEISVDVINNAADFDAAFACISKCFGDQIQDAIWIAMNPGWNTVSGKAAGIARMVDQWRSTTTSARGDANTVFLHATTLPDNHGSNAGSRARQTVGVAIWDQFSMVEGLGNVPSTDICDIVDVDSLLPGNEVEQLFLKQMFEGLVGPRVEAVTAKAKTAKPAVFNLSLCVVDPAFQRRSIASKLVQWGLDEAKRRGHLEAITEASAMGRHVYAKLGFRPVKDVIYPVDEEFRDRKLPPNLFMRTGADE